MIARRASQVVGLMNDRGADGKARSMQRSRGIREPRGEPIAILDVDVLDIELNAPVPVALAQLDERRNRTRPRCGVGEKPSQRWLIEAFVHDEWHQLHATRFRERDHTTVELPIDDTQAV